MVLKCGAEMWCEEGVVKHYVDVSVRDQLPPFTRCFFTGTTQPNTAAGSWQEWSGWKTSDRSWGEGVWNEKRGKLEGEKMTFVRKERSGGACGNDV